MRSTSRGHRRRVGLGGRAACRATTVAARLGQDVGEREAAGQGVEPLEGLLGVGHRLGGDLDRASGSGSAARAAGRRAGRCGPAGR